MRYLLTIIALFCVTAAEARPVIVQRTVVRAFAPVHFQRVNVFQAPVFVPQRQVFVQRSFAPAFSFQQSYGFQQFAPAYGFNSFQAPAYGFQSFAAPSYGFNSFAAPACGVGGCGVPATGFGFSRSIQFNLLR